MRLTVKFNGIKQLPRLGRSRIRASFLYRSVALVSKTQEHLAFKYGKFPFS
jgi:hypothetical protein